MRDYGVDRVFLQRFFNNARPENLTNAASTILKHAFNAPSDYKCAIAITYDLSGLRAKGEGCSVIIDDWKYLLDGFRITNQPGTKTNRIIIFGSPARRPDGFTAGRDMDLPGPNGKERFKRQQYRIII